MSDPREPHPLFPMAEDAEEEELPPDVHYIQVTRREAAGLVTAPNIFEGPALTDLAQLHDMYGGGIYELIARGIGNARIVARKSYTLPGPPKPMFKATEESAPVAGQPDIAKLMAMMSAQQPQGFSTQTLIALLGVIAPVVGQWLQNSAQTAAAQHTAQQNFLAMMLTQSQSQSDKFVSVMQSLHNSVSGGGGGVSGVEFQKGAMWMQKWMEEFIAGQQEGKAEAEGEPTLKDLMGLAQAGLEAYKNQQPPENKEGGHLNAGNGAAS